MPPSTSHTSPQSPPSSSPWPPTSLTTVLVPAAETIYPVSASIKISAPASVVFSTLLDTSTYPKWNTWCPSVTIRSQPDGSSSPSPSNPTPASAVLQLNTHFILHVIMDASKPDKLTDTPLYVTDLSTPESPSDYVPESLLKGKDAGTFMADLGRVYRVAWTTEGGFLARGLKSERFHEVVVLGENECEVRTWECLGGVLARAVKWFYGETLMEKFGVWVGDLKGTCEKA